MTITVLMTMTLFILVFLSNIQYNERGKACILLALDLLTDTCF